MHEQKILQLCRISSENINYTASILLVDVSSYPVSILQVIAFFIVWVGCWLPIAVPLAMARGWRPFKLIETEQKLPLLASLYLLAPLVLWIITRGIDKTFSDYGLTWTLNLLSSLSAGFAIGVLSLTILFGIQTALGWIRWQKSGQQLISVLLPTLLLAVWISGTEELVFRGFILTQLQEDYAFWLAASISSVIFAVLHLIWEQEQTIPQLPGLWLMGMVLVLARLIDRGNLGLAWGLHSGWVWAIASLDTAALIAYTGKTPEWITGKYGKPLAGVLGICLLLVTGIVLWLFAAK